MLITGLTLLTSSISVALRRDKSLLYARSNVMILTMCIIILINQFAHNFQNIAITLFHGFFHYSPIVQMFHIFILVVSIIILQINSHFPRKIRTRDSSSLYNIITCDFLHSKKEVTNKTAEQFTIMEYTMIITFIVTGGMLLISCSDLISLFLSIELQSYGLYILCSTYRDSEKATSAGLTYFLLGGLSSCFILLSAGLFYANLGNTNFDGLYIVNDIFNINNLALGNTGQDLWYVSNYIEFSLLVLSVGFLFKMAAAPFHFWSPDVYDAIPTVVTTFVAIFAKISVLLLLLDIVYYTNNIYLELKNNNNLTVYHWIYTLLFSSLFSLIIGSLLGLSQIRIKRLYAYSTISHIGFILLAICINSMESVESFLFYLVQYSFSNLNAFLILIAMGYSLYLYKLTESKQDEENTTNVDNVLDKKNSPLQYINQIKGYLYNNPVLCISLGITIFSFVGIPPLVGFFAKQMVLTSALDKGFVFFTLIAILTSVISAYYYLTLIKQMFFNGANYEIKSTIKRYIFEMFIVKNYNNQIITNEFVTVNNVTLSSYLTMIIAILTLLINLFLINPQEILRVANILAISLFKT